MAALLRAGLRVSMAGHAIGLLAGVGVLARGASPWFAAGLAAWGYLVYLQLRVAIDAELFGWLASGAGTAEMDGFLVRTGLLKRAVDRPDADRVRGAMALWRRLLGVLAFEFVAVLAGLAWP